VKKHPIFKGLKLPGGANAEYWHDRGEYFWSKSGGYADSIFEKLYSSLKKEKWKLVDESATNSPDGNVFGRGIHYQKGNHILSASSSLGCTKYDNFYSVNVKVRRDVQN
jgi:hypothetical protein